MAYLLRKINRYRFRKISVRWSDTNHAFFVRLKMLLLTERQRRQTSIKLTDDKYARHASWTDSPLSQKKSSGKTTGIKHRPFIVIPGHFYTYNVLWIYELLLTKCFCCIQLIQFSNLICVTMAFVYSNNWRQILIGKTLSIFECFGCLWIVKHTTGI